MENFLEHNKNPMPLHTREKKKKALVAGTTEISLAMLQYNCMIFEQVLAALLI